MLRYAKYNSSKPSLVGGGQQAEVLNSLEVRLDELTKIFGAQFGDHPRKNIFLEAYARIASFLDKDERVKDGLRALSAALDNWMTQNGTNMNPWRLRLFLHEFEAEAGFHFGDRQNLYLEGLICPDGDELMVGGFLSREAFLALIGAKATWDDPMVPGTHGALTHRIQWWLIQRELGAWFAANGLELSDLYAEIAKHLWPEQAPIPVKELFHMGLTYTTFRDEDYKNWSLWDYLVDLPEGANSARCPDFIGENLRTSKYPETEVLRTAANAHDSVATARKKELMPPSRSISSDDEWISD